MAEAPIAALVKTALNEADDREVGVAHFHRIEELLAAMHESLFDAVICQQRMLQSHASGRHWRNIFLQQPLVLLIEDRPRARGASEMDRYVDGMISLGELNRNAILREVRNAIQFNQLQGQFREVLDKSPDGIIIVDHGGEIIYLNTAAALLFQRRVRDMLGENFGVPLTRSGKTEIELQRGRTAEVNTVEIEWMGESAILANIRDITAHKRAERSLAHAAHHDSLTALPNRSRFQELLSETIANAQREQRRVAVLFIDLDKFKEVNDTLGHDAGDQLLQLVADRLRAESRENTVVARLGGDEFIMLASDIRDGGEVMLANRLLDDLQEPFDIDGNNVVVGASIGVAVYPDAGSNARQLVMAADAAMYDAKEAGRNNVKVNGGGDRNASRRQQLRQLINTALHNKEFELVYQPIFDVFGNRTHIAEALIRWNSEELGTIFPGEFIPISELSGWLEAIGRWAIVDACRQLNSWKRAESAKYAPDTIWLNLSVKELCDPALPIFLERVLRETGVATSQLAFEVAETELVHNLEDCYEVILQLREAGFKIAIDQFGTGYTDIDELADMPVDIIKIDRTFIDEFSDTSKADVANPANIRDTTRAAINAGMKVVAVGVEDTAAQQVLIDFGVSYAQGYLLGKPVAADEMMSPG